MPRLLSLSGPKRVGRPNTPFRKRSGCLRKIRGSELPMGIGSVFRARFMDGDRMSDRFRSGIPPPEKALGR